MNDKSSSCDRQLIAAVTSATILDLVNSHLHPQLGVASIGQIKQPIARSLRAGEF